MHNLCILFAYSMHNPDTKPKNLVFIRPSSIKKGGIKSELSVYVFCLIPYNISIWAKKKLLTRLEAFRATGWNRTNDIRIFSPALYQLSYCGVDVLILYDIGFCVNTKISKIHFFAGIFSFFCKCFLI